MKGHVVDSGMFALNAYFWGIQSLGGHEMHVPEYTQRPSSLHPLLKYYRFGVRKK